MNFTDTDCVGNCIWYQMEEQVYVQVDDQVYYQLGDQVFHQIFPIKYKIHQEINK